MNANNPKFSILCPSYNHEKYVGFFIESVLAQREQDFELIIVDDCSSDKNIEEIRKFEDSRIKLIQHDFNKGVSAGLTTAFEKSTGKFLALSASDDVLMPNYLMEAYKVLNENHDINVVYCNPIFVDENGKQIPDQFFIKNQSRYSLLRAMFLYGNCLPSPGMVVRKEAFEQIMPLDLSLVNYQDYHMHVKLMILGKIFVNEKRLIKYRRHNSLSSLSSETLSNRNRGILEIDKLMDVYLNMKDVNLLQQTFPKELKQLQLEVFPDTAEYVLARIAMTSNIYERKAWGFEKIMSLINDDKYFNLLNDRYDFTFKTYLSFSEYVTFGDIRNNKVYERYKKFQKLFNATLIVAVILLLICLIFTWDIFTQ